ncbi:hypothetical protein LTR37_020230 [Vermiconidia calcicola]|uniref:Uncharacterized protein n=1 Tax=Vermiconidia calcicola TaxID=1690605 RepID=A0ACC3MBU8_9PEZI|nr:hypothetical protein LTR37_020230 [Vermiconidia calcicola]
MVDYQSCTLAELADFVKNRDLLPFIHATVRKATRADYVDHLTRADRYWTFRFFDLPPELRNRIRRNLLLMDTGSFTCHPQILVASKQTNHEASSILYGENIIDVELSREGVLAHGCVCGPFYYSAAGGPHKLEERSLLGFQWPCFLQRTESMHFDVLTRFDPVERTLSLPHESYLETVLYSLCRFVQCSNKLNSFELRLLENSGAQIPEGELEKCVIPELMLSMPPLRLVRSIKRVYIGGFFDTVTDPLSPAAASVQLAKELIAGFPEVCERQIRASATASLLIGSTPSYWTHRLLKHLGALIARLHIMFDRTPKAMRMEFGLNMARVRLAWTNTGLEYQNNGVMRDIYQLLEVDIEMKRLLGGQGRFKELEAMDQPLVPRER